MVKYIYEFASGEINKVLGGESKREKQASYGSRLESEERAC